MFDPETQITTGHFWRASDKATAGLTCNIGMTREAVRAFVKGATLPYKVGRNQREAGAHPGRRSVAIWNCPSKHCGARRLSSTRAYLRDHQNTSGPNEAIGRTRMAQTKDGTLQTAP